MIEITKIEPINRITSTLVCPRLSIFKDSIVFIVLPWMVYANLINAGYIASDGTYVLGCIQSACIIAKVRPINQ